MPLHATYITQTQYFPADMMQRDSDWINPGVLSTQDMQVTAPSPANMVVNVSGAAQGQAGGNAWLPGGYRFYNDSTLNLPIQAADATNPRIDLVVAGIDTTTTPYTPTIKVITGTPAGSPSVPATPSGYISLAKIAVAANATSIGSANITDTRTIASLVGVVPTSAKGQANGVATLDGTGKVPSTQLPAMNYIPTSAEGANNGVATLDATGNVPESQLHNVPPVNAATGSALGTVELAQLPTGNPIVSTRVADQESVQLTTTAATTVGTFTPAAAGFFEIACHFRITANVSVGITVSYAGSQGALTTTILNSTAYTFNSAAGADNDYDTIPVTIRAVAGTAINVQFTASVANAVYASANITGR